jgi:hypothetical protein
MSLPIASRRSAADRPFPRGWLIPIEVGRWLLLGTALLQAATPALIPFAGSAEDPPVVPAGYAFSIWSVILAGCLAAALLGWPARRAASPAYRTVHLRLSVVHVLFLAWLLAARSSLVWLTLPIFLAMLALTLTCLRGVLSTQVSQVSRGHSVADAWRSDRLAHSVLGGTLGVYAGWSTAAIWINLASLLTQAGISPRGGTGTAWQSLCLLAACASTLLVMRALSAPLPYVLAVAWAFAGVVVSAAMANVPALAGVAVVGLVVAAAAALSIRRIRPFGMTRHPTNS